MPITVARSLPRPFVRVDRKLVFARSYQTKKRLKMTMKRKFRHANASRGEHRIGFEQRRFTYAGFIPERRSGKDRRDAAASVRTGGPSAVVLDRN